MASSISSNGIQNGSPVSAANAHDTTTTEVAASRDGVQFSKADGLRGALGLHEVSIDGHTKFMTKQELEHTLRLDNVAPGSAPVAPLTSSVIKKMIDMLNSIQSKF